MKALFVGTLLLVSGVTAAQAQVRTTETRTSETQVSVDTTSGKVMKTETVSTVEMKEDLDRRHHLIQVDPVRFAEGFNIGYQYAVAPMLSVGGGVRVPWQGSGSSGYGISGEGRFYPGGNIFKSFHLISNVHFDHFNYTEQSYNYATSTSSTNERSVDPIGMEVSIGWNWEPWNDFSVEAAIGGDFVANGLPARSSSNYTSSPESSSYTSGLPDMTRTTNGMGPAVRLQIGYSW